MKYLKSFENIEKEPQVGDYVLMKINVNTLKYKDTVNPFINNTIGLIIKISGDLIRVRYDTVPPETEDYFSKDISRYGYVSYSREFRMESIFAFGSTIEEVELEAETKKYNI